MAGAEAGAVVAVEVLEEQDGIAPIRVVLKFVGAAVHRSPSVGTTQKDTRQAARQLGGDLPQAHHPSGAGGTLNGERVTEEMVELRQRLNDQIVHREPDRATPVRVAAEQRAARLRRFVVNAMLDAMDIERVGMVAMVA